MAVLRRSTSDKAKRTAKAVGRSAQKTVERLRGSAVRAAQSTERAALAGAQRAADETMDFAADATKRAKSRIGKLTKKVVAKMKGSNTKKKAAIAATVLGVAAAVSVGIAKGRKKKGRFSR